PHVMLSRHEASGPAPPLSFVEDDFESAGTAPCRQRSFMLDDLEFRARRPANPFATPHGEVAVDGRYVTASDGVLRGRRHVTKGRVPLALPGTWVFTLDPEGADDAGQMRAVDGTVTVFIAAGAPFVDQAPRVMRSLTQFFAQLADRIDTRVDESAAGGL